MIVILKRNAEEEKVNRFIKDLEAKGFSCHYSEGQNLNIIGIIGSTANLDEDTLRANEIVENVKRVSEPFKIANRKFHPDDSIYEISGRQFGGNSFNVIAGPCSVESEDQIISVAESVKKSGATFLRGGAFKPRTSPYAFQGLHDEGIKLLIKAKEATGLPIVTELMDIRHIDLFADVDVIQIGARNMQNFEMLKELGKSKKPILLKRGLASTIEEWVMSAEYIMANGNENVIFCERGIRTYETFTRNTLDLSAIPALKSITHMPIVVDPSHATGLPWMVKPLAKAAAAVGADGIMIEVHNDPPHALCDGAQSLTPEQFDDVMKSLKRYAEFEGKTL